MIRLKRADLPYLENLLLFWLNPQFLQYLPHLTLPTAKAGGFASPATVIKSVTLNLKKVSHAELRFPLRSYALLIQITALSLH